MGRIAWEPRKTGGELEETREGEDSPSNLQRNCTAAQPQTLTGTTPQFNHLSLSANPQIRATVISEPRYHATNPQPNDPMNLPQELQTERLLIHAHSEVDCGEIFARYAHDPHVTRYLSWKPHETVEDTIAYRRERAEAIEAGCAQSWLIRSRQSRQLLGMIGLRIDGPTVTLGYCLARDAWGQGHASEAASAIVAAAANEPAIWRIQAFCHPENCASARVLEKVGLMLEGRLRRYMVLPALDGTPSDVLCYAKVREADA